MQPYTIAEHLHRFAAWAASTAASQKNCRFKVAVGRDLIEASGLREAAAEWRSIPIEAARHDKWHRVQRSALQELALTQLSAGYRDRFTHGVAAKLVNVYLKGLFFSLFPANPEADALRSVLHPPIDRVLLTELARRDVGGLGTRWKHSLQIGWSNFNCRDYQEVIEMVREVYPDGLWKIEHAWSGSQ